MKIWLFYKQIVLKLGGKSALGERQIYQVSNELRENKKSIV